MVVEGYTFPENSLIFGNLYSIHHDEKYWGDPQNFRIDRWIDDKGQPLYHADHFMPFSIGELLQYDGSGLAAMSGKIRMLGDK